MELVIEKPILSTYQNEILYNSARFTITEASTKVGKTFSHIWWLFECAVQGKENQNFWWVAPVYSQTKIAFKRLVAKIGRYNAFKINESNLTITLPTGSIIQFKSAEKPNNLFGEDVFAVVFDEAPRSRVEAFYALRSTITYTGGKLKMIGNFGGTANWMHQLKEKALTDDEYAYFKVTAWDAVREGILTKDEVDQAQKDLPPKVFKSLYLAEEQESEDMLVSYGAIKDLWTNTHVEDGIRYITADIALHGSDRFVLLVWSGLKIIDSLIIDKCDADEVEKVIKDKADQHKVGRSNIAYDDDGLGSFLRGYLKGARPYNGGGKPINSKFKNLKNECIYKLAALINDSSIFIDCDIEKSLLIQELECLESYNLDKDQKIQALPKDKIKVKIGRSPDILDALTIRMIFELRRNVKVGSSLL